MRTPWSPTPMRAVSARLQAGASIALGHPIRQLATAPADSLLPGKQERLGLYRALFRAHRRGLPKDLRLLSDAFIKSEWKAHQKAQPAFVRSFLQEWAEYLRMLQTQVLLIDSPSEIAC
jgi:hypothetical protein